jgi:DNA invertase Pin-like site-specific DNA recombinase
VATFEDKVSGAKGRDKRPQFDALLKAAVRREFDMIAVWSSDRLGRSMSHLIEVLETIKGTGVGLYIHTQVLDTTTPAGKLMFQITGAFAEFERSTIRMRVNAGLKRAKDQIKRDGHFVTKHGEVRKRLGRPAADPRPAAQGMGGAGQRNWYRQSCKQVSLGVGTVAKLKDEMAAAA